ncbi:hypothetical protein F4778DRAFT_748820 [Xylariomycetidae sp. FL2044]|nr:hypothetical protein F4778DRAFT_748820 [Xylariomycetidae sp. FL2044]
MVLLIAVEENSLAWEEGITIALQCRDILREYQILDIEVEIREGRHELSAASAEFEAQIDPQMWHDAEGRATNEDALPLLSHLGYPIGYLEDRKGQGTVGLHLRLEGRQSETPIFYGLTCRHVVRHDRADKEAYTVSGKSRQGHIQANGTEYDNIRWKFEVSGGDLQKHVKSMQRPIDRWSDRYQFEESKQHLRPTDYGIRSLDKYKSLLAYHSGILDVLKELQERNSRSIGHLAYHPSYEISSDQPGYLTDWALIELDPEKFASNPENNVYVGDRAHDSRVTLRSINGFIKLRMEKQEAVERGPVEEELTIVAKRGATTGLTFGIKSEIEAVVRHPSRDGKSRYAWEMLIISMAEASKPFSSKGDSGSSIFDREGRVVGLVNASNTGLDGEWKPADLWKWRQQGLESLVPKRGKTGVEEAEKAPDDELRTRPRYADVTFASPIERVLEDIERFTGLKPQLV